jgi:16S rRNA processing protein RimM
MEERGNRRVTLGRVAGLHGLHGWLKVLSYTEPPENILAYAKWQLLSESGCRVLAVTAGRAQGRRVLARLENVSDRDQAAALVGADIAVTRAELPATEHGEYYWSDLEGLNVRNLAGETLGTVTRLFATGANDVMVVSGERERLLPFVHGTVVKEVDLAGGEIRVDWDAEF